MEDNKKNKQISSLLEETRIVRVHSAAIHIENKTKLVQRKAWFELVYKALPSMHCQNEFSISIKDLKEAIGWDKSKNDEELKELLHNLSSTSVQWNILEKDKTEVWESNALLAGCRIVKGSGICNYAFSPFLQKKLLNPEMYAKIDLIVSHKFKSKYSLAIYCLALDYLNIKINYGEKNLTIEEIRKYLGLKENEYKLIGDLNRWVLKPSEEEINQISDMRISITPIVQKRKTLGFKFIMRLKDERVVIYKSKKNLELISSTIEEIKSEPNFKLEMNMGIHIDNDELRKFFAKYNISIGTNLFQEKLKEVKEMFGSEMIENYLLFLSKYAESEYKKGNIKNFAGFFVSLFKDNTQIENYLYELELESKKKEARKVKIDSLLEVKIKEKYETAMSNAFEDYMVENIEALEEKFIEIINTHVTKGFARDYLINNQNKGIIDKTLLLNHKRHVRLTLITELKKFQDELGYKKLDLDTWKKETINDEYLEKLRLEIEKDLK